MHYKDKRCRNSYILEFDFKINYEDGTYCLLEYDGSLHYKTWNNSKESKKHLARQKENDTIKNNFCKENNIYLLRIPYWDYDNIEKILTESFCLE